MTGFPAYAAQSAHASWIPRGLLLVPLLLAVLLMHGLQCGSTGTHDQLAAAATTPHRHVPGQHAAGHAPTVRAPTGSATAGLMGADHVPEPDRPGTEHLMQVCFALLVGGAAIALSAGALVRTNERSSTGPASGSGSWAARRARCRPPDLLQLCVSRT